MALLCSTLLAAERKPIAPAGVSTIGPYSPAILTGEYLYISGQVGRLPSGAIAATVDEQARLVLKQIQTLAEAAGLTMEHIVSTQLFLTDIHNYEAVNRIYATFFPGIKPSRVTVGVARLPAGAAVEITAIAVRHLKRKQPVSRPSGTGAVPISEGIKTADRFFLSGTLGRDPDTGAVPATDVEQVRTALRRAKSVLQLANLTEAALASFTVFHTRAIKPETIQQVWASEFGSRIKAPVSMIEVNAMALGTNIGVTGVAALKPASIAFHQGCAALGETLYCAAQSTPAGGTIGQQTAAVLQQLSASITASGFRPEDASATQVYLGNVDDFDHMNTAYSKALKEPRPARATLQPAPGSVPLQVSVIVSRSSQ